MIVAALAAFSSPALGQNFGQECGPRDRLVEALERGKGETKQAQGVKDRDTIFEIFRNDDTGTWTIIMSSPGGISCIKVEGTFWVYDPRKPDL